MSRAVSAIRRWRVGERTGGSRGGGVPRGVMRAFLWHGGGVPERFAWLIGRRGVRLKRPKTVDQAYQLGWMQQGHIPATTGGGAARDAIGRPGREGQDTAIRVLHDIFEQLAHPADVAEWERVATQGMDRILDRNRS
jgi:hypothetical protein